jgi:hypothetical protein
MKHSETPDWERQDEWSISVEFYRGVVIQFVTGT